MGSDADGKYFLFYDNTTGKMEAGTSVENKLYCDRKNFILKSTGADDYVRTSDCQSFRVTQISRFAGGTYVIPTVESMEKIDAG